MTRRGKSKHKAKPSPSPSPYPSSAPKPSPSPERPPIPPPSVLFPHYNPHTCTPLPPPSMPKKPFFRRAALPLVLAAAAGAYMLNGTSEKQSPEKDMAVTVGNPVPVDNRSEATISG